MDLAFIRRRWIWFLFASDVYRDEPSMVIEMKES